LLVVIYNLRSYRGLMWGTTQEISRKNEDKFKKSQPESRYCDWDSKKKRHKRQ